MYSLNNGSNDQNKKLNIYTEEKGSNLEIKEVSDKKTNKG